MALHNVAGTIHGTAGGSVLRLCYSTLLSGFCGVSGGKWKEWRGDEMAG